MMILRRTILGLVLLSAMTSCIWEGEGDNCPPSNPIAMIVADKNYLNVDDIEPQVDAVIRVDENLPIMSYAFPLKLWWHRDGSSRSQTEGIVIGNQEKIYSLKTDELPIGVYDIVFIGNDNLANGIRSETIEERELHPSDGEYNDIYIGHIRAKVPVTEREQIELYRVKGKLLVKFDELPATVKKVDITVSGVHEMVRHDFMYDGTTDVTKSFDVAPTSGSEVLLDMLLAPTPLDEFATMTLTLTGNDNSTTTLMSDGIKIERNEITLIRPLYEPVGDTWEVYMFINGEWEKVSDLQVGLRVFR